MIRFTASQLPCNAPCRRKLSSAYSEQVGVNRQPLPGAIMCSNGEMQ